MAVTAVRKIPFSERTTGQVASDGVTEYTQIETWHVIVEDIDDLSTTTACLVAGIPQIGQAMGIFSVLFVRSHDCVRSDEAPLLFVITVTWGTIRGENPTDLWNITVGSRGVEWTENTHQDNDTGDPIANSVGDPFDPPEKKTFYDEEIAVGFNTRFVDWEMYSALRGQVNTEPVVMTIRGQTRTFAVNTLKLAKADYDTTIGNGQIYYKVSLCLHYKPEGWTRQIVDRGYRVLDSNGDPINALDEHGNAHGGMVYLDGNGNQLADGDEAVTLPFEIEDKTDLNQLLQQLQ